MENKKKVAIRFRSGALDADKKYALHIVMPQYPPVLHGFYNKLIAIFTTKG